MSNPELPADGVFQYALTVPADAIDENGHVNNVVYLQWMQEAAIRHSIAAGGTAAMRALHCTWIVRSHKIEYRSPAYAGDVIQVETWVAALQRVRSLRQYRFVRTSDGKLLASGETEWVFVTANGRPCAIPDSVRECFPVLSGRE